MARTRGASRPPETVSLSRDDQVAMLHHHLAKLRPQSKAVEELAGKLSGERKLLTELFLRAKADTSYNRKELAEVLTDSGRRMRELVETERRRATLRADAALPVGGQLDLFGDATTPTEARDELELEAEGYLAGRRADDPVPPEACNPRFHQAWLQGWHKGQEQNALQMARASEVLARKHAPALEPSEAPADEPDLHETAATHAKRLKASGWTDKTADDPEAEAA